MFRAGQVGVHFSLSRLKRASSANRLNINNLSFTFVNETDVETDKYYNRRRYFRNRVKQLTDGIGSNLIINTPRFLHTAVNIGRDFE